MEPDIIIVGAGAAGLMAARELARAGKKVIILEARDLNCAHQLISHHPSLKYGAIFEIRPDGDLNELLKASEQRRQKNTAR